MEPIRLENLMSFSPADISVYFSGKRIGTCLSVTYSVTREVVGLFGLGDPNAIGFNRGKRGIAGSLVFNQFQNHPLLRSDWANAMNLDKVNTLRDFKNVGDNFKATVDDAVVATAQGFANASYKLNTNPSFDGGTFDLADPDLKNELNSTYNLVAERRFNYADQLPPFDIVLTFVNEMGDAALMSINSVILANEGSGFSVDDITSEVAFTYVARSISPLRAYVPKSRSIRRAERLGNARV